MEAKEKITQIIKKWYKKLEFNEKYDEEFYESLKYVSVPEDVDISNYDVKCEDGKKNLLSFLYMCEKLRTKYVERGISEDILIDTLEDIVRWCDVWSELKNELYLGELNWLSRHLGFKLFQLGRLQFCIGKSTCNRENFGIKKGDDIIEVHIPASGPLDIEECKKSFVLAREFFKKYFPEINYEYFSCHSWLLDETLKGFLSESSNIIQFGNMFLKDSKNEDDGIIRYVFGWKTKREQLGECEEKSLLAKKIKEHVAEGKSFYCTWGFIRK